MSLQQPCDDLPEVEGSVVVVVVATVGRRQSCHTSSHASVVDVWTFTRRPGATSNRPGGHRARTLLTQRAATHRIAPHSTNYSFDKRLTMHRRRPVKRLVSGCRCIRPKITPSPSIRRRKRNVFFYVEDCARPSIHQRRYCTLSILSPELPAGQTAVISFFSSGRFFVFCPADAI